MGNCANTHKCSIQAFPALQFLNRLLQKYQPHGNRIYDVEIVSIALANGVGEIRTANIKDFAGISEIKTVAL
jgi:hypothetical protein